MKTMKSIPSKQKGFTLLELVVFLVIATVVAAAAVRNITRSNTASDENRLISELNMLRVAASNFKGTRQSYSGISCDALIEDEYIEVSWDSCTGANPRNGNYSVEASSSNSGDLTITATGLGEAFCNRTARTLEPNTMSASCSGGTLAVGYRG